MPLADLRRSDRVAMGPSRTFRWSAGNSRPGPLIAVAHSFSFAFHAELGRSRHLHAWLRLDPGTIPAPPTSLPQRKFSHEPRNFDGE